MVVHVHGGKGGKDRDIVLSPHLRDELRAHYRPARKPAVWLFPIPYPVCDVFPISTPGHPPLALPAAISQPRGEAKPIKDRHQVAAPRLVPCTVYSVFAAVKISVSRLSWAAETEQTFFSHAMRIHTMMPEKHTTITNPFSNPC